MSTHATHHRSGADTSLLAFARAVRAAGVPVTQDRSAAMLAAVARVGLADQRATYVAGRATLCGSPEDVARYDRVFEAWFSGESAGPASAGQEPPPQPSAALADDGATGSDEGDQEFVRAAASAVEVLRHRDVAGMSAAERRRLAALFSGLRPRSPRRRTARKTAAQRGRVDADRTLRASLRQWGEPAEIRWQRAGTKPRRIVFLIDVSGSMSNYADALLRLAHRVTTSKDCAAVETFTLGTRLTSVTRAMRLRDADRALAEAGESVPDWSGGTRLGDTMGAFVDRWGRRGLARGAVVVIFSDGWERGDPALLGEQVRRLQRIAHRVVWVNPHRGKAGYQPLQQGVQAVLPHVDDFLAGHSFATFEELMEVLARA